MNNIIDYTIERLEAWMLENDESKFRAKQVISWIYKGAEDFEDMKNLPKTLIVKLKENFYIGLPKIEKIFESKFDGTKKMLLRFNDGNIIESVIMKYKHGYSVCVSTQVGCRMGCKFCASTIDGKVRDLTGGEIIAEILTAQKVVNDRISNVVLMGSGEPFDNYDNVLLFLELVNADYGLNIGQRHITISTCGIVPKIYDLADKDMQITLAISLHAFSDDKRREIMPIANKYSISEIIEACKYYIEKTNKRISFEYALAKDNNDNLEDAKALVKLLKGMLAHVNLIPINKIESGKFTKSTNENIIKFRDYLNSKGIVATIRRELGNDINASCGQLRRGFYNE